MKKLRWVMQGCSAKGRLYHELLDLWVCSTYAAHMLSLGPAEPTGLVLTCSRATYVKALTTKSFIYNLSLAYPEYYHSICWFSQPYTAMANNGNDGFNYEPFFEAFQQRVPDADANADANAAAAAAAAAELLERMAQFMERFV